MPRYVALLRAINVGGHVVTMDRLRTLFSDRGLTRVESYIASGNILFDADDTPAPALEAAIERHLEQALGYPVATFLRTAGDMAALAALEPFGPAPAGVPRTLYVTFHREPPPPAYVERVLGFRSPTDDFRVLGRETWWSCLGRSSDSAFGKAKPDREVIGTMRNVSTVRKVAERLREGRES
jgi:uncharacterized protein (DUF1697 family)